MEIAKKLSDAGYRMFGDDESIEKLILDILKTENIRYLKAIPFLLYKYNPDIERIKEKTKEKELFNTILDITARIFIELDISKQIRRSKRGDSRLEGDYAHKYLPLFNEFKAEFELQSRDTDLLIDTQKNDEERNLQYGLSQLFTKKEKHIIKRLQKGEPISKTEYEYYSRKTKKKLRSILFLQDFARNISEKNPEFDEDLFELKRRLEEWLPEKGSIEEFHISDNKIIMGLRGESGEVSTSIYRLSKIKDKKILSLLKRYEKHDFR